MSAAGCPFCLNRRACRTNSLARLFPEVAQDWHPTRNGALTPNEFLPGSDYDAWWLCPRGHEYQKRVRVRKAQANPCPACWGAMTDAERYAGRAKKKPAWDRGTSATADDAPFAPIEPIDAPLARADIAAMIPPDLLEDDDVPF